MSMGIYIPGMEMPIEKSRIIQIYPDGTVRRLDGSIFNSHFEAVPVPPHGRLIDANALINDHLRTWTTYDLQRIANAPTIIPEREEGET